MAGAFDAFDASRFAEAVALFESASQVCTALSKADANTSAWVTRRVKALNNCAAANDRLGRLDVAEVQYAAARALLTSAWSDYSFPSFWDPNYAHMLAHVDKKLGMFPRGKVGAPGAHVGIGVDVAAVLLVGRQMVLEAVELYKAGAFEPSAPLLEQALAIQERHGADDGVALITIMNNLAATKAELGQKDEARALYLRALCVAGATEEQRAHVKNKLALLEKPAAPPPATAE
jgi:tetratricopeptide (TPR) repeat protein